MKGILQCIISVGHIDLPQDDLTLDQTRQTLIHAAAGGSCGGHEDLDTGWGLEAVETEWGTTEDQFDMLNTTRTWDGRDFG
jgi:hypothetical protein